jgi:hypothetical protein
VPAHLSAAKSGADCSIEGNRGQPRGRHIRRSRDVGTPTLINSVETCANCSDRQRGAWLPVSARLEQGTKVFARRRVNNTGLISAYGHHAATLYSSWVEAFPRPQVQGSADGRAVGRLRPRTVPRHAGGLRVAGGVGSIMGSAA